MDTRRRRITSGLTTIALLVVSITVTATLAVALLIDTVTAPALSASASPDCMAIVQPVHTIEFVELHC